MHWSGAFQPRRECKSTMWVASSYCRVDLSHLNLVFRKTCWAMHVLYFTVENKILWGTNKLRWHKKWIHTLYFCEEYSLAVISVRAPRKKWRNGCDCMSLAKIVEQRYIICRNEIISDHLSEVGSLPAVHWSWISTLSSRPLPLPIDLYNTRLGLGDRIAASYRVGAILKEESRKGPAPPLHLFLLRLWARAHIKKKELQNHNPLNFIAIFMWFVLLTTSDMWLQYPPKKWRALKMFLHPKFFMELVSW